MRYQITVVASQTFQMDLKKGISLENVSLEVLEEIFDFAEYLNASSPCRLNLTNILPIDTSGV